MIVYQLLATGRMRSFPASTRTIHNKVVFTSEAAAERRKERFKAASVDDELTGLIDDSSLFIQIVPLEVVEEN